MMDFSKKKKYYVMEKKANDDFSGYLILIVK